MSNEYALQGTGDEFLQEWIETEGGYPVWAPKFTLRRKWGPLSDATLFDRKAAEKLVKEFPTASVRVILVKRVVA